MAWSISGHGSTEYPSVSLAGLGSFCSNPSTSSVSASAPLELTSALTLPSGGVRNNNGVPGLEFSTIGPTGLLPQFVLTLLWKSLIYSCQSEYVHRTGLWGCMYNVVSWWDKETGQAYQHLCLCWCWSQGHWKWWIVGVIQLIWNLAVFWNLDLLAAYL